MLYQCEARIDLYSSSAWCMVRSVRGCMRGVDASLLQ